MNIAQNGSWLCETSEPHGFDEPLARAILVQMMDWKADGVKDFGCGSGAYVEYFNRHGFWAVGYDGNPNTQHFGNPSCYIQDLSVPFDVGVCDVILSLEVGEHIPQQFEQMFLDNLAVHAGKHLILSWFPRPGHGIGHVNERPNDYIIREMMRRRFEYEPDVTAKLREASTLWWFKESIMVYERR